MMMNEIRNKIDEHLAWCIAAIRTQHVPANPWDRTGISAAMRDVQHRTPLEVFTAAYQLATNPAIDTPKVLTMEGPHWATPDPKQPSADQAPTDDPRCEACFKHQSVHDRVMTKWPHADRHPFIPPRRRGGHQ